MEASENQKTSSNTSDEPILIHVDEDFFEMVLSGDHGSVCLMLQLSSLANSPDLSGFFYT